MAARPPTPTTNHEVLSMMAATATAPPPTVPGPRRPGVRVEQPPRVVWPNGPDGDPLDVTGLDPDAFFEAITKQDRDRWDYPRLAAEAGRSIARVRKWVMNAYALEEAKRRGEEPPPADDKTFIVPHGHTGSSPWWYAGEARRVLNMIGVMRRDGTFVPYKPSGRPRGSGDRAPRQRWTSAPARDTAPAVQAAYRELTGRKTNPLTDRQARAELCARFNLNRRQLAWRLGPAPAPGAPSPGEVDNAALRARYLELLAEQKVAGYSDRGASERARAALAGETGLNRRQLAARIAAADQAAETVGPKR